MRLARTRSSVQVDDNNWTFGQILPVFLFLGTLLTTAETLLVSNKQASASPMEQHIEVDTPAQPRHRGSQGLDNVEDMGLSETSKFRQQVATLLERDYYNPASCPWIPAAITLPCIQILLMTILFFWTLSTWGNAASVLAYYAFIILVGFPSSWFLFILFCILYEKRAPGGGYERVYWMVMILISAGPYAANFLSYTHIFTYVRGDFWLRFGDIVIILVGLGIVAINACSALFLLFLYL